jgi:hypothetical protein
LNGSLRPPDGELSQSLAGTARVPSNIGGFAGVVPGRWRARLSRCIEQGGAPGVESASRRWLPVAEEMTHQAWRLCGTEEQTMSILINAALGAGVLLAASQPVPSFDVDPSCSAAARQSPTPDYMAICRATEEKARTAIVQQWAKVSAEEQAKCIPLATTGGTPTYTELLTCIELMREAKRLRAQESVPPTTSGQGVHE